MNILKLITIAFFFSGLNIAYAEQQIHEHDFTTGISINQNKYSDLLIEHARAKSTIPGVKVSAGYVKLTNTGDTTMKFVNITSDAAKFTEFHNMVMDNNKMVMRKVDVIEIKPQQHFIFKEKSYHLMFMGLTQRFTPGESITVTLFRENGQQYEILLPIMEMPPH